MTPNDLRAIDGSAARCRLILSLSFNVLVAMASPGLGFALRAVLLAHLVFSSWAVSALRDPAQAPSPAAWIWVDLLFAGALAGVAVGDRTLALPFLAFAVVVGVLRRSMQQTLSTAAQGWQRASLRQREDIARELHDGSAQALAVVDLRLEKCRRLLARASLDEVRTQLAELQQTVRREHDSLRSFSRSLAGVEVSESRPLDVGRTTLRVSAEVSGSAELVDQVLGIAREGLQNLRRHAGATSGEIAIRGDQSTVYIDIGDDGIGFPSEVPPWSIASRVREIGGQIRIVSDQRPGAHLAITLPGN